MRPCRALLSFSALIGLIACDTTPPTNTARLAGSSTLVFRCVEGDGESLKTFPLERCGCLETSLDEGGVRSLSPLSRAECATAHPDARLIGYLGSETQGRVATLELGSGRQIADIDPTIPGVSHIGFDGLISALAMHPYGDHLLLLNGPEGTLSLLQRHGVVSPERTFELNHGPLTALAVWPKPNEPLPEAGSASFVYLYAPLEGELLELDLDALSLSSSELIEEGTISRRWSLTDDEGAPLQVSALTVDARAAHLVVAHADEPALTVIDLTLEEGDVTPPRGVRFGQVDGCQDLYLTRPVDTTCEALEGWPEGDLPACADGVDNDEDGLIDRADPGCERESDRDEADSPELSSVDGSCEDGVDNDGDGLVDGEDPGCVEEATVARFAFERPAQCSDGVDNDQDGLIDFDAGGAGDPDCLFASDQSEGRDQVELGSARLLATTLALPQGERSFAYAVSPGGALISVDLDADVLEPTVISPAQSPLALELRRTGALASLFYVTGDSSLEQVHLTAPEPLVTPLGSPVYALGTLGEEQDTLNVEAFYSVIDHRAYLLSALAPWVGEVAIDARTQAPALPLEAKLSLEALDQEALTATPLTLDERRGEGDLQVYTGLGRYPLYQGAWNRVRDAAGQRARVLTPPTLSYKGVPALYSPERHPALCQLIGLDGDLRQAPELGTGPCTLVGEREDGSVESIEERAERLGTYLNGYEGVFVRQASEGEEIPSAFSISYEGALPGSLSESGSLSSSDAMSWRLVDYEVSFCEVGVEEGDLLVVDRFEPAEEGSLEDPDCLPYLQRSPNEGLYPLRYRVAEVRGRGLTLVADERVSYERQLGVNSASIASKLATPLPPPPAHCVADRFQYELFVGADQWLVTNSLSGYVHPWVSEGGGCVERASGEGTQRARAKIGERYQGPWLTFQLGYRAQAEAGALGIPEGSLPMMVGARLELSVSAGQVTRRLSSVGLLPMELRWLPELDRLYVVDSATQSTVEFDQIDPYTGFMRQVQIFE